MEEREARVPLGSVACEGNLGVPDGARGVVLFAHGSGSGRHSPRNRYVAQELRQAGLATLLIDLLWASRSSCLTLTPLINLMARAPRGTPGKEPAACRASHGDDDSSLSVSFFEIPDGLGGLGERVSPVDDRCELPGFDELLED